MPEVIVTIARDKTFKWKPQTMQLLQLLKLFSAVFAATAATNNFNFFCMKRSQLTCSNMVACRFWVVETEPADKPMLAFFTKLFGTHTYLHIL